MSEVLTPTRTPEDTTEEFSSKEKLTTLAEDTTETLNKLLKENNETGQMELKIVSIDKKEPAIFNGAKTYSFNWAMVRDSTGQIPENKNSLEKLLALLEKKEITAEVLTDRLSSNKFNQEPTVNISEINADVLFNEVVKSLVSFKFILPETAENIWKLREENLAKAA